MKFEVGTKTDVGRLRSKNEDAYRADPQRGLFIVADGLGGHRAGEVASTLTVEEIFNYIVALEREDRPVEDLLREAVQRGNQIVHLQSLKDPSLRGMGTTVVIAMMEKETLWLGHVGDSRAYLLSEEGLEQLTEDHSLTQQLIDRGEITPEEACWHPYRGMLSRSIGLAETVSVDIQELKYTGELLVLCTDGLTDMITDQEIEDALLANPEPQKACDVLVEMANEKGGIDNITVIIVRGQASPT